jgi:hypothetical protein
MFDDFSNFYASNIPLDNNQKCIIFANNKYKIFFDLIVLGALIFTTLVVPWRLAFSDGDPPGWIAVYFLIDAIFTIDIVLTFFTSYTDEVTQSEIFNKKSIAINYFKGWFWFDILSVIPIDYILAV